MIRRTPMSKYQVIILLVSGNPKHPTSAAFQRFDLYRDGMTVGDFLNAGGTRQDLWYDQDHGFIRVV